MNRINKTNWKSSSVKWLVAMIGVLPLFGLMPETVPSAEKDGETDSALQPWLKPQEWRRDSETPALALGEKGRFDDQHIFAPHVIQQDGEFWMYYSGSQRCVEAG